MNDLIERLENEGIYEEPKPPQFYTVLNDISTKLMKYCILSKKYPQLLDEIRNIKDDLDRQNSYGVTALMWASIFGLEDATKILIDLGANLDLQNYWGKTALMYACSDGNEEIVKLLVLARANIDIIDNVGDTTIDCAKTDSIKEVLKQGPMTKSATS